MAFEIEEVDDEEFAILNESPVAMVVNLEQYKYDEFWSDPCWSEPPGPLG
jgi:hypothetical protein